MRKPSKIDDFFIKYINTFAYYQKGNQNIAALNLMVNGYKILYGATIIKRFETYKSVEFTKENPPNFQTLLPFINDSLMDDTRIITCFENYMKGVLILNDFVVHLLTNKNKDLKYEQRDRPIKITEVFTPESFLHFNHSKPETWETIFQTLSFSWMLKLKYQDIINFPVDILSILTGINEERNKLHFISVDQFQFGKPTIDKYSKIINFANDIISRHILDLDATAKEMLDRIQNDRE